MTKRKKLTPAKFQPHLLAVLGSMTDFKAGVPVQMQETYGSICERMGLKEDSLGVSSHGSLTTHRMIGYAMRGLRDKGLGDFAKKGQWVLTQEGVHEAYRAYGVEPEIQPVEDPEPEVLAVAKVETETVVEVEKKAEVVHLPVKQPTHPYSDDPYVRGLAIAQTPCFGTHSERSKICADCPLQADCLGSVKMSYAHFAAVLDAADAAPPAPAEPEAKPNSLVSLLDDLEINPVEGKAKFVITKDMVSIPGKVKVDSLCSQCMGALAQGQDSVWVHEHGQFHAECVTKAT